MRKDRIAERLLVLVTGRERAASIVGDMMESAAARGRVWFWSSVLRSAAFLLWGGFAANPRGLLGLAFLAWLMGWLLALGMFLCADIGLGLLARAHFMLADGAGPAARDALTRAFRAGDFIGLMLCQFVVGRWIARCAPGRELSAWLALLIMDQMLLNGLPSIVALALGHRFPIEDWAWQPVTWMSVSLYLSCLAGAIRVRRRALA